MYSYCRNLGLAENTLMERRMNMGERRDQEREPADEALLP